jgi:hypothetical protein
LQKPAGLLLFFSINIFLFYIRKQQDHPFMLYPIKSKCLFVSIVAFLLVAAGANAQMRQVYVDGTSPANEIKKISFYSPSEGYVAAKDPGHHWVGYTTDSGRSLLRRPITPSNVDPGQYLAPIFLGFSLSGVKAFDQNKIIAYGHYLLVPSILYSTNGGLSYTLVFYSNLNSSSPATIFNMNFPENGNLGFAVDGYRILRTTDGGQSWSVVNTDPAGRFGDIDAIDNNNVFVYSTYESNINATGNKLVKTSNAGLNWQELTPPHPRIFTADFYTPNKGWISVWDNNQNDLLYYTSNGGLSWSLKNDPVATPASFYKMKFVNDSTGFGITDLFDTYKTSDSGKVWEPLPRDNNFSYLYAGHNDLQVISPNQLWSGGAQDFLEISTNADAAPLPKAYFKIDTTGFYQTNTVNLRNFSKPGYQYKWFLNNTQISTSYHTSYVYNNTSSLDSISLVVISGTKTDTLKRYQHFIIPNLPFIASFNPVAGSIGTLVTIKGHGFTGVNAVKFGGVAAASFTILSDTVISAIVGTGATGNVSVTVVQGTYSLPQFTYFAPPVSGPPLITSVTPGSGLVGTVVTITGSNFAANSSANIVWFGSVRAIVSSSSPTQIVCTVPAGANYEPISALNMTTGLTGFSIKPFNITFPDSANFTQSSFKVGFDISTEGIMFPQFNPTPLQALGKDADGDGKPDIVACFGTIPADSIMIYPNNSTPGNFSFSPRKTVGTNGGMALRMQDLDGDGRPEIIGGNQGSSVPNTAFIRILKNQSTPGTFLFTPFPLIATSNGLDDIILSDLDKDGRTDLAFVHNVAKDFAVIRNTSVPGILSFAAEKIFPVTTGTPKKIIAADFDGDGKNDIVCYKTVSASDAISISRNLSTPGNIVLSPAIDFATPGVLLGQVPFLQVSDFDNDNKPDLIVIAGTNYAVFRNTSTPGNISFSISNYPVSGSLHAGAVENLSGDAKPDIISGNANGGSLNIRRNISTPGAPAMDPMVNLLSRTFYHNNTADFDLDGKSDFLVVSYGAMPFAITVFENKVGDLIDVPVCAGTTKNIHTDLPGTSYQWQENTGSGFINLSNNSPFSGVQTAILTISNPSISLNGRKYRCLVDGLFSSTFNLQVIPVLTPAVSISTPNTTICAGSEVSFTSNITNPFTTSIYRWYVNGIQVGTNSPSFSTSALTNNAQVKLEYIVTGCTTTNLVTSNTITMIVTGTAPSVSIVATTPACSGIPSSFTATAVNGGANPVYQWQVNGANAGTNSSSFSSSTLPVGAQVSVMLTVTTSCSSLITVPSNIIPVIAPVIPSVSIAVSNTTICSGNTASFIATPVNGGTVPSYQWQVNGVNAGSNSGSFSTSSLTNGNQVKVIMTSTAGCPLPQTATSNTITMTVTDRVTPAVIISGNTAVISGQSTTITGILTNGGSSPLLTYTDSTSTHSWQAITAGSALSINYTPAQTGDKMRWQLQSNGTCLITQLATSNTLVFTVNTVTALNPVPGIDYGISYAPNPVNSILYIDSLKLSDKWQTLEIISIDGKKALPEITITNRTRTFVNVERLPSGQYIAILRRKTGVPVFLKFVKQ